jgi:hypothetical protein
VLKGEKKALATKIFLHINKIKKIAQFAKIRQIWTPWFSNTRVGAKCKRLGAAMSVSQQTSKFERNVN